jgi:ketosteroid isomerase-like protein
MSEEIVEIVRRLFDDYAQGDLDSWRGLVSEDVVWDTSESALPATGMYEGRQGIERFFIEWTGAWRDPVLEAIEFVDAGESVVTTFRWRGRGKASCVETAGTFYAVYDLKDGLLVRFRAYQSREDALEAAGVTE